MDQETLDHQTGDRQAVVDQHEQHEEIRRDVEQEEARQPDGSGVGDGKTS